MPTPGPSTAPTSYRVGVDVGGTHCRAGVVEPGSGQIVATHKLLHSDRTPEGVADSISAAIRSAASQARLEVGQIARVGLGVPGPVDAVSGVAHNAANLGWRGVPIGRLVEARLGIPTRVANDMRVNALGEALFGAAAGKKNVVLFNAGTGVGIAVLVAGELVHGTRGAAGEIGHTPVRVGKGSEGLRACGCGKTGCVEAYAGGGNIAKRVSEELAAGLDVAAGHRSVIRDLVDGDVSSASAPVVDQAYRAKDPYAVRLWEDEVGPYLGAAMANVANVFDPEVMILAGGVFRRCPGLLRLAKEEYARSVLPGLGEIALVMPALGDDAGIVGAAMLP